MVSGFSVMIRGRVGERLGGLELAVGVDDLGALLPLRLGLEGHGALHVLGQVHLLDGHLGDLDAPGVRVRVDDGLELPAQLVALGEQLVERGLAQDGAQRCLGELGGGVDVVLHLEDGLERVHDPEVDDRVHLHRDVVPRDDVLGRHVHDDGAQGHPDHAVEGLEDEDEARALRCRAERGPGGR